jgi:hypothetical protein
MTPEKFARMFKAIGIPITEEEWYGLKKLFEALQPGVTDCLQIEEERDKDSFICHTD